MITASCKFCDEIREEANGQEIMVGVYQGLFPVVSTDFLSSLAVAVAIHVPLEDKARRFAIRFVDDFGQDQVAEPSAELVAETCQAAQACGFDWALFEVQLGFARRPLTIERKTSFNVLLIADGVETRIGALTVTPPSPPAGP